MHCHVQYCVHSYCHEQPHGMYLHMSCHSICVVCTCMHIAIHGCMVSHVQAIYLLGRASMFQQNTIPPESLYVLLFLKGHAGFKWANGTHMHNTARIFLSRVIVIVLQCRNPIGAHITMLYCRNILLRGHSAP